MPRVFVSYVHENQLIVDRLTNILTAHGVSVWLDHTSLQPGQRWVDEIRRGIQQGDFFLACFSPEYASRPQTYMNEELTLAIDQLRQRPTDRSWFIPVFLSASSSIPDRNIGGGETLSSIQHVSLADDWDEGIRRLLEVIGPKDAALRHAALAGLADVSNRKRIAAADALGAMGASALFAVPKLASLLKDKNETVVAAVAEALGNICGGSAGHKSPEFDAVVRTLLQTIKTADVYYFTEHAVRALLYLGTEGMRALLEAQSAEGYAVASNARRMILNDPARSIPALLEVITAYPEYASLAKELLLNIEARQEYLHSLGKL